MSRDTREDSGAQDDVASNEGNATLPDVPTLVESKNTLQRVQSHNESNHGLRWAFTRNHEFDPEWEPFRDNYALQLNDDEVDGVIWFMKPTRAMFTYLGSAEVIWPGQGSEQLISEEGQQYADAGAHTSDIQYKWTSRNNRKGRHTLVVHQHEEHYDTPPPTGGLYSVLQGIWRMVTVFAVWDISYLLAVIFTLAVILLLINAGLSIKPYTNPNWTPPASFYIVQGVLAVVGCSLFLLSSFLGFLEAANSNRRGCLGWKREHISYHDATDSSVEHGSTTRMVPDRTCVHRTHNIANLFRTRNKRKPDGSSGSKILDAYAGACQWRWFPSNYELWKHFIYDVGFVTSVILLLSSSVYCGAGYAALISIVKTGGEVNQWIRIPQLIAGLGFTLSSILFMLETQTRWLVPEFRVLAWWISFWNLLGSAGFTVCAAFALASFASNDGWAEYQFALSYMWGSAFFTIGSGMQWYEALDKHPVLVRKKELRGEK